MITLQRKLAIKVKDQAFKDGKAPKNISQGRYYAVIGYSVQLRMKGEGDQAKEYEEIAVFLVVNNREEIGYIYPSLCEIYVDPFSETVESAEFMKEGRKPDGESKAQPGAGQPAF